MTKDQAFSKSFESASVSAVERRSELEPNLFATIVSTLRRSKWLILFWFCLVNGAAAIYIKNTAAMYTSIVTLVFDPKRSSAGNSDLSNSGFQPILDSAQAESQIQIIRSERLLRLVFDSLSLNKSVEFSKKSEGLISQFVNYIRPYNWQNVSEGTESEANFESAFANFFSRISARRIGQSYAVEISYTSTVPSDARIVANAIACAYLSQQLSLKLAAAQSGGDYFQSRINSLTKELSIADAAMLSGSPPNALLPDADARIIGAALEPLGKSAPKSTLILSFASSVSLLVVVFLAAISTSFDNKIRNEQQLIAATRLKLIGKVRLTQRSRISRREYKVGENCQGSRFNQETERQLREISAAMAMGHVPHQKLAFGVVDLSGDTSSPSVGYFVIEEMASLYPSVFYVDAKDCGSIHARNKLADISTSEYQPNEDGLMNEALLIGAQPFLQRQVVQTLELGPSDNNIFLSELESFSAVQNWKEKGVTLIDLPLLNSTLGALLLAKPLDKLYIIVKKDKTLVPDVLHTLQFYQDNNLSIDGFIFVDF